MPKPSDSIPVRDSLFAQKAKHSTNADARKASYLTPSILSKLREIYAMDYEMLDSINASPDPGNGAGWAPSDALIVRRRPARRPAHVRRVVWLRVAGADRTGGAAGRAAAADAGDVVNDARPPLRKDGPDAPRPTRRALRDHQIVTLLLVKDLAGRRRRRRSGFASRGQQARRLLRRGRRRRGRRRRRRRLADGEGRDVDGRDGRLADERRGDGVLAVAVVLCGIKFQTSHAVDAMMAWRLISTQART